MTTTSLSPRQVYAVLTLEFPRGVHLSNLLNHFYRRLPASEAKGQLTKKLFRILDALTRKGLIVQSSGTIFLAANSTNDASPIAKAYWFPLLLGEAKNNGLEGDEAIQNALGHRVAFLETHGMDRSAAQKVTYEAYSRTIRDLGGTPIPSPFKAWGCKELNAEMTPLISRPLEKMLFQALMAADRPNDGIGDRLQEARRNFILAALDEGWNEAQIGKALGLNRAELKRALVLLP